MNKMSTTKPNARQLLEKMQNGTITPEEQQWLLEWYEQLDATDAPAWESDVHKTQVKATLQASIQQQLTQPAVVRSAVYKRIWWSAAAAIILAFTLWLLVKNNTSHEPQQLATLTWTTLRNDSSVAKKLMLPDSSIIWLKPLSQLRYNNQYNDSTRTLYATGEMLVSVQPNSNRPFRLVTQQLTTTVLGTVFNVEAYEGEAEIKISLLQGKIRVADSTGGEKILLPGQVVSSRKGRPLAIASFENTDLRYWIQNGLSFHETLLTDALHRIEKKYHVQFVYKPALLEGKRVTTMIPETGNWEAVLQSMLFIHNIRYEKEGNLIRLHS